jgi:aerobic-type carbon monoxide dehydrogenase small subunit (CoxS/CutS family)
MSLIADYLAIPGFGLCCGMGSCGTCVVQIASAYSQAKRNVMACAILVNDELANMIIIIPDKIY